MRLAARNHWRSECNNPINLASIWKALWIRRNLPVRTRKTWKQFRIHVRGDKTLKKVGGSNGGSEESRDHQLCYSLLLCFKEAWLDQINQLPATSGLRCVSLSFLSPGLSRLAQEKGTGDSVCKGCYLVYGKFSFHLSVTKATFKNVIYHSINHKLMEERVNWNKFQKCTYTDLPSACSRCCFPVHALEQLPLTAQVLVYQCSVTLGRVLGGRYWRTGIASLLKTARKDWSQKTNTKPAYLKDRKSKVKSQLVMRTMLMKKDWIR